MKTSAKRETVLAAIAKVNKAKKYKIELNRDEQIGKYFFFTLKSKSGIPGARFSHSGRKIPSASWHAHGFVFEEIFKKEPNTVLYSGGEKITSGNTAGGNWQDRNIGSMMEPKMFSETSILSGKE